MTSDANEHSIQVMLADDNEDDIVIMVDAFEEEAMLCINHVVRDGREALTYLRSLIGKPRSALPNLVLLDINMPHKNGFEVLAEIKSDASLMHIPVVMLTTSNRDEDIVRAYQLGAASYVTKPVDYDGVADFIHQFSTYWSNISAVPRMENYEHSVH